MSDEELALKDPEAVGEELTEEEEALAKLKEAIVVEKEDLGALRLRMTVTIPEATLAERRGEQFAELKREAAVPGFRKGHAPQALIEKRFASDVGEQLKSQLIGNGYLAAVEKEDLEPLGDPLFCVTVTEAQMDDSGKTRQVESSKLVPLTEALERLDVPKSGDLTFSCELELKPEFTVPKLEGIPLKKPDLKVSKSDVDAELERLCKLQGRFEPVDKGTIQADDMMIGQITITVDGGTIFSEDNYDVAARDITVSGIRLEGFGKAAAGKKLGATIEVEAKVSDDHEKVDLRGKTAKCSFEVKEIKRLVVPPVDEEFLTRHGFDSEKDLRDTIEGSLEANLARSVRNAMHEQVADYLVDKTKIEIPEGLSRRQTERSVARRMIDLYQMGIPESEIEKRADELRTRAHDQAIRDLKLYFVLEQIAEDEEIRVGEEQLNAAIAEIASRTNRRFDRVRDELSKGEGLTTLYVRLRDQMVLDKLVDRAAVTEAKSPKTTKSTAESKAPKSGAKADAKKKPAAKAAPKAKKAPAKKAPAQKPSAKPAAKKPAAKAKKTTAKSAKKKK